MQTRKNEPEETESALALRLVRGVHAGAERRCGSGGVVVIGGGDDGDLILSDEAVHPHHCIVSVIGTDIGLRAVEASVRAGGRKVPPGEPVRIAPFEVFQPLLFLFLKQSRDGGMGSHDNTLLLR